ncbi:MAG: fluoride efflux transporter CrcB [Rhizobacter sp.]|nr:fluoride efflux transporter CrcB [Rhizobacter sp.]
MNTALPWAQVLAVAAGAAVGALLRWAAGLWLNGQWQGFPLGTLLVNCVGGLMIGAALVWFDRSPNELLRLLLVTGFLGGLTTFSAFSGESLSLMQRGEYAWALAHAGAHVVGSLACAAIGFRLMRVMMV